MTAEQGVTPDWVNNQIAAAIATPYIPVTFSASGTVTTVSGGLGYPAPIACTIAFVKAYVATPSTSGSVVVDVLVNGSSIFTSTPHRPTITSGTNEDDGQIDITTIAANDVLQVSVTSAGTGAANLTVAISLIPLV